MTSARNLTPKAKSTVPVARGESPIRGLQNDVNRLFNDMFGDLSFPAWDRVAGSVFSLTPAVDIAETDKGYRFNAELPGLEARDVIVSIAEGYITLKGEKRQEASEARDGYFRQERSFGSFKRVLPLPADADPEAVEAEMKHGVLTVSIGRKPDADTKTRKITIREFA